MSRFLAFLRKEFYHIFRDPRTLIILFGIPIAQLMLFGYVMTNEVRNVKLAIVDHSKDDLSKRLSQQLLSSGFFRLAAIPSSESDYESLFRSGKVKEIVVFEPDFAKNLMKEGKAGIQVIADLSVCLNHLWNCRLSQLSHYEPRWSLHNQKASAVQSESRTE